MDTSETTGRSTDVCMLEGTCANCFSECHRRWIMDRFIIVKWSFQV